MTFPPKRDPEGVPGVGDARIYRGTVDLVSMAIARRFYAPAGALTTWACE